MIKEWNGRGKFIRDVGFPIAACLMMLAGLGVIGQWMIGNQTRLIDSTIETNASLINANNRNAETFEQIKRSLEASSAVVLQSVHDNGKSIQINSEVLKSCAQVLNERTPLLEEMHVTQQKQQKTMESMNALIEDASVLMAPVPKLRSEQLDEAKRTNQLLTELLKEGAR
jgi:hypothetical protein